MTEHFWMMAGIQAAQLFCLAAGFVLRKMGIVTDPLRDGLSVLMLDLFLPCMTLSSFPQELRSGQAASVLLTVGISAALCVLCLGLGRLLYGRKPPARGKILRYGTMIPNAGFAGLSVMQDAYGATGVFYASMFVIPIRVFLWSFGVALFTGVRGAGRLRNILLNPCIAAVYIGAVRMVFRLPVPGFVDSAVSSIGNCCTSVSMLFIGAVLADADLSGLFSRDILGFALVRLAVVPGITFLALHWLPLDGAVKAASVILMGMPIATTATVLASQYGADAGFASQCMFVTTLLSMVTIPLWAALL